MKTKHTIEQRNDQGEAFRQDNRLISGYSIVFDSDSVPMVVWNDRGELVEVVERITPESLRGADMSETVAAINHDFNQVLARTDSGTLDISVDEKGVFYRFEAPKTTYANDLLINIEAGNIRGSSFYFSMDLDKGWDIQERADGKLQATIQRVVKIHEMGPVTKPAYPETTAENRSAALGEALAEYFQRKEQIEEEPTASELYEHLENIREIDLL